MARCRMDGGAVVDTENSTQHWNEAMRWNGNNHETLYRSRKGRYYLEHESQGLYPIRRVSNAEAARWLLANAHGDIMKIQTQLEQIKRDLAKASKYIAQTNGLDAKHAFNVGRTCNDIAELAAIIGGVAREVQSVKGVKRKLVEEV